MGVPRDSLPALKHELRLILEGQGPENCKLVLESKTIGARFREHAETCGECREIVRELYVDGVIPVSDDTLTKEELEELLRENND